MVANLNQKPFHRHSIRLPGHDYSEVGSYFVTLLTHDREPILGKVVDSEVHLSDAGLIVWEVWKSIPKKYPQIDIDTAVVMPNHFHAIITINDDSKVGDLDVRATYIGSHFDESDVRVNDVRAIHELPLRKTDDMIDESNHNSDTSKETNRITRRRMILPKVIGYLKMQTGKQINLLKNTPGQPVWHRNYYEHIILNDKEFADISDYIEYNPANWGRKDEYYQ